MKNRNCPNCGAPYELDKDKCPYCGTIYYDLSAIDFDCGEPVFLKFRIRGMIVTQKCIPSLDGIEIESDEVRFTAHGKTISRMSVGQSVRTNIRFDAVCSLNDNGELIRVEIPEGSDGKLPLNYS